MVIFHSYVSLPEGNTNQLRKTHVPMNRQAAPRIDSPDPPGANPAPPPFASCWASRGSVHLKDDIEINFILCIYIYVISHLYIYVCLYLYLFIYINVIVHIYIYTHIFVYVYVLEIGKLYNDHFGMIPLTFSIIHSDVVVWSMLSN